MKNKQILQVTEEEILIQRFNKREEVAFETVHGMLYESLFYFSSKLYKNSELIPQDALQDLFMKLWVGKHITFTSLEHIKAYLYNSIYNNFREYYSHRQVEDKYQQMLKNDQDHFISYMVETEVIAELSRMPDVFPAECAKVLKLYLEGWDIKDIAKKLGKSQSTIYSQRQEVIAILKKILNRKLFSLLFFYHSLSKD